MSKVELKLDWCTYEAAKYAVMNWHYSQAMPAGKLVKVGVWEDSKFIGVVLFGRGANQNLGKPFGLKQTEICELVRIALKKHTSPVSKIAGIAVKLLRKQSPGLRLIVSYACPSEGHHGGVYQAMGWIYTGKSRPQKALLVNGKPLHKRTAFSKWKTNSIDRIKELSSFDVRYGDEESKHSYYLPLDNEMREQIAKLAKPYPKRVTSIDSDASGNQSEEGGASPTVTLHKSKKVSNG
jgi:hypothetical protein